MMSILMTAYLGMHKANIALSSRGAVGTLVFLRSLLRSCSGIKEERFAPSCEYPTHHNEAVMNGAPRSDVECDSTNPGCIHLIFLSVEGHSIDGAEAIEQAL